VRRYSLLNVLNPFLLLGGDLSGVLEPEIPGSIEEQWIIHLFHLTHLVSCFAKPAHNAIFIVGDSHVRQMR